MKTNERWSILGVLLWVTTSTVACADRSPSPPPAERFSDEESSGDGVAAGKALEKDPAETGSTSSDEARPAKPLEIELAANANASLVEAKKLLDAAKFEDLLGVIAPAQAARLGQTDRQQLADIYYAAASVLRYKRKDVAFSSMFCERGLLASPAHPDLLRLQVRNYLHPNMKLISGAEELVERLVKLDPQALENQLLRGKVAFEQADWDTAVFWLKKAARVGRTQGGKLVEEAWKLHDLAQGRREEIRSALSMTRELELRMRRARIVAHSKAPKADTTGGFDRERGPAALSGGRVVLYMTRWCKYCRKTRELLNGLNIKFEEKDIEKDQSALMEMMQAAEANGLEVRGVPVVQVGSKLVVGYNPDLITSLVNKIR